MLPPSSGSKNNQARGHREEDIKKSFHPEGVDDIFLRNFSTYCTALYLGR
jgi:hypothetical protein